MKYPDGESDWPAMDGWPIGAYPPPGFMPFAGCDLGNGDYFGLYWPTGKENDFPVVCEMSHDDFSLMPRFSSYEKWKEWAEANDWEWGEAEVEDDEFVLQYLLRAKSCLRDNDVEQAIVFLEKACQSMPDLGEPWQLLASQRRRIGDLDGTDEAAVQAARLSSWVFASSGMQCLRMVRADGPYASDPLVENRDALNGKLGGTKENAVYSSLRACVDEYREQGEYVAAVTLLYNYGYGMERETVSFQERHGFEVTKWLGEYQSMCREGLGLERSTPASE